MSTSPSIPTPAELLSGNAKMCLSFIREHFPSKYDWLRLAEGAATQAASHLSLGELEEENALNWIRAAVELYEAMADHPATNSNAAKLRMIMPAIGLRALAIKTWGASEIDAVRELKVLANRFFSVIRTSAQELREDRVFPRSDEIRNALELTRYLDPLADSEILSVNLPDVFEYCDAARIARENARIRIVDPDVSRPHKQTP